MNTREFFTKAILSEQVLNHAIQSALAEAEDNEDLSDPQEMDQRIAALAGNLAFFLTTEWKDTLASLDEMDAESQYERNHVSTLQNLARRPLESSNN
jgi:hypothetical protein